MNEKNTQEMHTVIRDGHRDLRFYGEHLACADNKQNGSSRWTEINLLRTSGGKYVCERVDHTLWEGESDVYQGCVCSTLEEVQDYFGFSDMAKQLYNDAHIPAYEVIS